MSKIDFILVEEIHIYWDFGHTFQPYSTEIIACSIRQVENKCKKTILKYPKFQNLQVWFSKTWREKRQNMQETIKQIIYFLRLKIITNRVVQKFNMKLMVLTVIWYKFNGVICQKLWEYLKIRFCAMATLRHIRRGNFT